LSFQTQFTFLTPMYVCTIQNNIYTRTYVTNVGANKIGWVSKATEFYLAWCSVIQRNVTKEVLTQPNITLVRSLFRN
jgi:succinate-acetate transporter protein